MGSVCTTAPAAALQFLQALDAEADAFTFQTFDDDPVRRDPTLAKIFQGALEDHAEALADLNRRGAGVFVTVNETDGTGRRAENITRVRAVFADLDGADLGPVMEYALEPHIVVESSPGKYHAYWLVDDLPLDDFSGVQKAIAARFGSDASVHDLPRVMRLPGYKHQKAEAFETKVIRADAVLPYSVEKICMKFPPLAAKVEPPTMANTTAKILQGGRNNELTSLAGTMRRRGMSASAIEAALMAENRERCDPPLPDQEVRDIASSVAKYQSGASEVEKIVCELADLDPVAYDQGREDGAKQLGIRVATLDAAVKMRRAANAASAEGQPAFCRQVDPWPQPVDGPNLILDLVAAFNKYCVLPDGAPEALALWVIHSHAFDAAQVSPFIALISPEKRCGKSTVLRILSGLVPKPLPASNVTKATVFRAVEMWQPTLLIDEADTFLRGNELRGVLNAGHAKATAFVLRCVGDDHEPTRFSVWAPKAIAMIGKLPPTLEDRSITICMKRKLAKEKVARLPRGGGTLNQLAQRASRWSQDHMDELRSAEPSIPEGLHDRDADNWQPLIAIADLIGDEWPDKAREVAKKLSGGVEDDAIGTMLLSDIKAVFSNRGVDRITSSKLCVALEAMEDKPWPEWKNGKPITTNQLARLLKRFKIAPKQYRLVDLNTPQRGYERPDFEDAWARYTPDQTVTPLQPMEIKGSSDSATVTTPDPVTDGNARKPLETGACNGVTDQRGESAAPTQWPSGLGSGVAVPKPRHRRSPVPSAVVADNARSVAIDDPLAIPEWLRRH